MDRKILEMLEADGRLTAKQIALMLDKEEGEIRDMIQKFEADGVILGYKAIVDWDKTDREYATALIELKVTPQYNRGFDAIAERIYNYPEVQSVYLMSGAYDLNVVVRGKTFQEIAMFVSKELAVIDSVTSTSTQFVMRRYKEFDISLTAADEDGRENISL